MVADPPDLYPDETSHQKPRQNKSRRGRPRHNSDRNLNSNNDPSQQYGHFNEGFKSQFSHSNSNYVEHQHPLYRGEDGARWRGRGRGRREGNRGFGGSSPRWQRPGGNFGLYSGSNIGAGGYQSGARPEDGPDSANWRREDVNKNVEQTNDDQDTEPKKPRKFSQEQRRGEQMKKGTQTEKNISVVHQRSDDTKGENQPSEIRERTQRSRTGPDSQHDDHQRKHTETKRRHGPIKPPKPQPQEEVGSEKGASGQDDSDHGRPSQDPACKVVRGSGRHTPLQARGGRRTHQQHNRPGQRNWDKVPESKETQTG